MKIAPEGRCFIGFGLGIFVLVVVGAVGWHSEALALLSGAALALTGYCAFFFRDPPRQIPASDRFVLSPADGTILDVVEDTDKASGQKQWMIRIFLSIFDVHLQRAPIKGTIRQIRYRKGTFFDARDPRACVENEQNMIEIVPTGGSLTHSVHVTQIAGLIARRIVCRVKEGQAVAAGEQIGLIRFGSQVDITVPQSLKLRVKKGDTVAGGTSILADLPVKMG